jgi:hypothetical protein
VKWTLYIVIFPFMGKENFLRTSSEVFKIYFQREGVREGETERGEERVGGEREHLSSWKNK